MEIKTGNLEENNSRELIEAMSNTELADQLLIVFKKQFKKLFEEADKENTTYIVMDKVIKLNTHEGKEDYSEFDRELFNESWNRTSELQSSLDFVETIDIEKDKVKIITLLLLYKLVRFLSKNPEIISTDELEYLTHVKKIYQLYLSDSGLSEKDVEKLAQKHKSHELFAMAEKVLANL